MAIKITKDGVSNIIVADMDFAEKAYPKSEGYSCELVVPESTGDGKAAARHWRNQELENTDKIAQTPDWPERDKYLTYRTKLRDWPSTSDFPDTRPVME
tara:strand:+ start:211 stop:507 length:297 start_codon:yes stop_codon:yes gene_type:complete